MVLRDQTDHIQSLDHHHRLDRKETGPAEYGSADNKAAAGQRNHPANKQDWQGGKPALEQAAL